MLKEKDREELASSEFVRKPLRSQASRRRREDANAKCALVTPTADEISGVVSGFGGGIRRRARILLGFCTGGFTEIDNSGVCPPVCTVFGTVLLGTRHLRTGLCEEDEFTYCDTEMLFSVNPLSLCMSQSTFEAWLRESGHLEILDKCTVDQARAEGHSSFSAIMKALRINPFRSLTIEDCCKGPVSWTGEFFDCGLGPKETYSFPRSLTQTKLRMEENVKRYTGNYLVLALVILLCYLYKIPVALLGIMSILALWDTVRVYINSRGLTQNSFRFRALQILGNIGTIFIMMYCKVAVALAWGSLTSLLVVFIHSMLRRITVLKHPRKPAELRT
ncbi:hypothetical protein R1flu_013375 [Riccia fluitans]|uniref:PRA1 family protein n=1 Tax=Riccia fluitans TaxID=41844 RepID=A0ABD1YGN5_9MARC